MVAVLSTYDAPQAVRAPLPFSKARRISSIAASGLSAASLSGKGASINFASCMLAAQLPAMSASTL